jgi:hypothetical protein
MYCAGCGNQIKKGLNYCNSCGARVSDPIEEKMSSITQNISTAIGFIGVGGIVAFIFLVKILLENNVAEPVMVITLLAYLATIFGICFLLIKQMAGSSEKSDRHIEFQNEVLKAIKSADTNQLEEPKQAPASVVENTTRTLDKVPVEQK